MNPSVSIIISTQNRADSLRATLDSLANVEVPAKWTAELWVVDNGSSDHTRQVIEETPRKGLPRRFLYEPRRGKSRALNAALRQAAGDILLFTDDDVRFAPDWIERMCRPIIEDQGDIVQGGVRWAPHLLAMCPPDSYVPKVVASTDHKSPGELAIALIGANMAMHRRVFASVDGFDEELGPGALGLAEETLLGWQLSQNGFRRVSAFDVYVEHHFDARRLTWRGLLDLADKRGKSIAYIQHHWEHRHESWLGPKRAAAWLKDGLRTLISPSAWPPRRLPPEWKFSYRATRSRLRQLSLEAARPRRYPRRGSRALAVSPSGVAAAPAGA